MDKIKDDTIIIIKAENISDEIKEKFSETLTIGEMQLIQASINIYKTMTKLVFKGHNEEFAKNFIQDTAKLIATGKYKETTEPIQPLIIKQGPVFRNITLDDFFKCDDVQKKIFNSLKEFKNNNNDDSFDITMELLFSKFLKEHTELLTHFTLPSTPLTNLLKQFLNNPTRIENPRRNRISVSEHYLTQDTIITYKGKDTEYTLSIERLKELFAKKVRNGAKMFNFFLQKLNEQNYVENTEFLLKELVDTGIYANLDSAYRGFKNVTDKLMRIHVEGKITTYQGRKKKEVANTKASIVSARTVTYNKCSVILPPIIRNSAPSITILPQWSYALQSENAYMLLDYIYYLARQNTDKIKERGYFTINLDTVRQHLGLPSPEEVQKGNYNKLIINPIEDAITAIEDEQKGNELKITPMYNHDYKNIYEYLNGYLEIKLDGTTFAYMEQRAIKKEKKKEESRLIEAKKNMQIEAKKDNDTQKNE